MEKATIHLTGLGHIYVPGNIGAERNVYLCSALTKNGSPINLSVKSSSTDKTHYAKADEAEASGYYLREVSPHIFMLVSPAAG